MEPEAGHTGLEPRVGVPGDYSAGSRISHDEELSHLIMLTTLPSTVLWTDTWPLVWATDISWQLASTCY